MSQAADQEAEDRFMRLWSIHPSLLDPKGLVALWREALLAQKVLQGKTIGYRSHPQLLRFRKCGKPVTAISTYLWAIHDEATHRGYTFDRTKIVRRRSAQTMPVTQGQLQFEWSHLKMKLRARDPRQFRKVSRLEQIIPHPLFTIVDGEVEPWERSVK